MSALLVQDVEVRFGGLVAVDGVSLNVKPGEIVGLIGPNGAGKSTLLNAITGRVSPVRGEIRLGGTDLRGIRPERLRKVGLARTFQHPELFGSLTVADNLAVGAPSERGAGRLLKSVLRLRSQRSAEASARVAGDRLLAAIGASVWRDELADDVPHGARRLVAVARAISPGMTSMLLLDEPAAGLNDRERDRLVQAIRDLQAEYGFGVLIVEHNLELVMKLCDRICVMNSGQRIAYGSPEEVQHHPAVIDAYIGAQE